jgi:hypothetical protein
MYASCKKWIPRCTKTSIHAFPLMGFVWLMPNGDRCEKESHLAKHKKQQSLSNWTDHIALVILIVSGSAVADRDSVSSKANEQQP